jgi:hypothetical protein
MPNPDLAGNLPGVFQLARGQTRADRSDGERPVSARLVRSPGDDGTVDASGKGHSHPPRLPQAVDQRSTFLGQEGCWMHEFLGSYLPGREFPRQELRRSGGSGIAQEFTNRDLWGLSLIAGLLIP